VSQYIALLRAINAGVPMKMEDLRRAFGAMKFRNVRTVIASGNVCFETSSTDTAAITARIERGLEKSFGRYIPTIVLSLAEIEQLVAKQPFANAPATKQAQPQVTFMKVKPKAEMTFPITGPGYTVLGLFGRALCSVVDVASISSADMMRDFDKQYGKEVTTRNWRTVERILKAATS
jgi:uncharacterized protein (DUF1697 family)